MSKNQNSDSIYYRRVMREAAEESKTFLTIPANVILSISDNGDLGELIKKLMKEKIEEADKLLQHVKNLENAIH